MQRKARPDKKRLLKMGVPGVLIPGIILAASLGWMGWKKLGPDYYANKQIFPETGVVVVVEDGDTFEIQTSNNKFTNQIQNSNIENTITVRLVGVNAPDRGDVNYEKSAESLRKLIFNKKVWLEYDRYQDDKYGRILAWVWTGCEATPIFLPADYMHKSKRESNPGLSQNPKGCLKGKLVQEELLKLGVVKTVTYQDRGDLKYEGRLDRIH
jgi:endonuclease YncB( thermonuclease family)